MTVAELIAELQMVPPETKVLIDSDDAENQPISTVFLYGAHPEEQYLIIDCGGVSPRT